LNNAESERECAIGSDHNSERETKKFANCRLITNFNKLLRAEVTGEWRNLHNEELHNLYSSPDIIRQVKSRRMRWADMWHAWERRKVYKVLVENPEGKRPLGRPSRRWEDGIRMDVRERGLGVLIGFDWLMTGNGGGLL
jgi:hypothetical protein